MSGPIVRREAGATPRVLLAVSAAAFGALIFFLAHGTRSRVPLSARAAGADDRGHSRCPDRWKGCDLVQDEEEYCIYQCPDGTETIRFKK